MSEHGHHHESDKKAAYTGLIVGLIALLIMVTTIVKLTNAKYASHKTTAESTDSRSRAPPLPPRRPRHRPRVHAE
jgi:hypothetical protein